MHQPATKTDIKRIEYELTVRFAFMWLIVIYIFAMFRI